MLLSVLLTTDAGNDVILPIIVEKGRLEHWLHNLKVGTIEKLLFERQSYN